MRWNSDYPHRASDLKPAPGDLAAVQRFVNTADRQQGRDELDSPRVVAAWLQRLGWATGPVELTAEEAARVVAVREALRALLLANVGFAVDRESIRCLDEESSRAALAVRFTTGGEARPRPMGNGLAGALARLFAVVSGAQLEGRWPRLKACSNPDCGAAFYDASPARRAKWCAKRRCGNRHHARRAKRRRKRRYAQYRLRP